MTTDAKREHIQSLAALVAAGAASPQEQRELEELVAGDEEAQAEVRAYGAAAAALAEDLPEVAPPAGALAAIRGRIHKEDGKVIHMAERRRHRVVALAVVAAAAAAVFAFLWLRERDTTGNLRDELATEAARSRREISSSANRAAAAEAELRRMEARLGLVHTPALRLVSMGDDAGSHAKILVDPDGRRWLVVAHELPPAGADKDYQMWIIPRGEGAAPMPAGLLRPGPGGAWEAEVALPPDVDVAMAAISLENKGGVAVPTDVKMIGPL